MAKRTNELTVNPEYAARAMHEMQIDMDEHGLFCLVPSQRNYRAPAPYNEQKFHTVRLDESLLIPVVVECSCNAWEHYRRCSHAVVVSSFYKRIYASNVVKIEERRMMNAPLTTNSGFSVLRKVG